MVQFDRSNQIEMTSRQLLTWEPRSPTSSKRNSYCMFKNGAEDTKTRGNFYQNAAIVQKDAIEVQGRRLRSGKTTKTETLWVPRLRRLRRLRNVSIWGWTLSLLCWTLRTFRWLPRYLRSWRISEFHSGVSSHFWLSPLLRFVKQRWRSYWRLCCKSQMSRPLAGLDNTGLLVLTVFRSQNFSLFLRAEDW